MSENNTNNGDGGITFLQLLTLLLIGLKLTGYITVSWWWVLSPLWIPFVIGISILLVYVLGSIVVNIK